MKLFIYEHITSGALINTALPASLEREGNMMLHAIVEDFLQIADIEIIILRDGRLSNMTITSPALKCLHTDSEHTFQKAYNTARQQADFILPIAPETDGILFEIQRAILTEKGKSLGSQASAIAISSDKYQCYQVLQAHSIATPLSIIASEWPLLKFTSTSGYITKPRDGAGCVNTLFFPTQSTLSFWLKKQDDRLDKIIIQPYFVGTSISFSLLCSEQDVSVLSINRQHVNERQGTLSFSGCTVNGADISTFTIEQATLLAQKVHQAVAGLWGFIGIDVVVTDSDVMVVDINPRLTTSYIGLHESLQTNPAQLLLTMMNTNTLPTISHRQPVEVLL
jgi:predicted ATP-grasp superfamily ATP-dependent carboligase